MTIDDATLVKKTLEGSEDSFRELVERYQRPVYRLIVRMLRDPGKAEDLAQEVFLRAYTHLESYDRQRKFSSWLFKIAHNLTIDALRRGSLRTVPLDPEGDEESIGVREVDDPDAPSGMRRLERVDLRAALEGALTVLRPSYREVILLRFVEGLSYEEIAQATGMPLGTMKTQLHRARHELQIEMERRGFTRGAGSETSAGRDS